MLKIPSNDYSIECHNRENYPSTSEGSIGSFWKEKKRIREEEDKWWNSKTQAERDEIIVRTKAHEQSNYLYNE